MAHQPLGRISGHTGQDYGKEAMDADRNYWMSASQVQEYGMIDSVLTKPT